VLELWSAEGALAAREDYLRAAGFFTGRDGCWLVAEVYLGCGMSEKAAARQLVSLTK
jgi:hypothetical protein